MRIGRSLLERLGPRGYRLLFNLYPPYLGAGITVTAISDDLRRVDVSMRLTARNLNYLGTHFGGSLYSMCDPFYLLLVLKALGPGHVVWDRAASIEFVKPGRGTVRASFVLTDGRVAAIREAVAASGKVEPEFTVEVKDEAGDTVARVHKRLYVRRT